MKCNYSIAGNADKGYEYDLRVYVCVHVHIYSYIFIALLIKYQRRFSITERWEENLTKFTNLKEKKKKIAPSNQITTKNEKQTTKLNYQFRPGIKITNKRTVPEDLKLSC